jgi:hypothetical protein
MRDVLGRHVVWSVSAKARRFVDYDQHTAQLALLVVPASDMPFTGSPSRLIVFFKVVGRTDTFRSLPARKGFGNLMGRAPRQTRTAVPSSPNERISQPVVCHNSWMGGVWGRRLRQHRWGLIAKAVECTIAPPARDVMFLCLWGCLF